MKFLLIEPSTKKIATNIALMKFASWCEQNDHQYQYIVGNSFSEIGEPDQIIISCIFSFYSKIYEETIKFYQQKYPHAKIRVGGPFPSNNPNWFKENFPKVEVHQGIYSDIEDLPLKYSIDPTNTKMVMYASRGCPNKCGYCTVPKLEGSMRSFPSIQHMIDYGKKEIPNPSGIVLYDNNFTAHEYIDNICDEIENSGLPVDIHGLHASAFTEHQAERFSRLKWGAQGKAGTPYLRFSFDFLGYDKNLFRCLKLCEKYKIKAGFFCYLLFNWKDSPDDFWKRIELSQQMVDEVGKTMFLFPQRYEPLDSLERNKYVGEKWTNDLVRGVTKIYTFMHGFIAITPSKNIYNWIGHTKEEFLQHANNFSTIKGYRLEKGKTPDYCANQYKKQNTLSELFVF